MTPSAEGLTKAARRAANSASKSLPMWVLVDVPPDLRYVFAMNDEPDSLILRMLCRMDAKLDRMVEDLGDLKTRVGNLETEVAHVHVQMTGLSVRIDRIEGRLDRIERRLDLVES
ncbi:hypothetical protein J3R73_002489 [Labrys monachus]|uniref:Uncharacterized protein n=2 Tax=Labrys monachus TaxID=217067 RepID=A0ABU0FDL1_9HYPH|nr:hypothetical protein [Labrys monachus]